MNLYKESRCLGEGPSFHAASCRESWLSIARHEGALPGHTICSKVKKNINMTQIHTQFQLDKRLETMTNLHQ